MKKIVSIVLSIIMTLALFTAIPASAEDGTYKTMLPYYYKQLDKSEKSVYLTLRKAIIEHKSSVTVKSSVSDSKANYYIDILYYEDPLTFNLDDISWQRSKGKTTFKLSYLYTKAKADKMKSKMDAAAKAATSTFNAKTEEYAKILAIHDYLTKTVLFTTRGNNVSGAYGALAEKRADDFGYARAFSYICAKVGITNVMVIGKLGQYYYAWNRVNYNKKWYDIDVCSDDNMSNLTQPAHHSHFMNGNAFCESYDLEKFSIEFPKSTSDRSQSYYSKKNLIAKTAADAYTIFREEVAKAANNGKQMAEICFESKNEYDKFAKTFPYLIFSYILIPAGESAPNLVTDIYNNVMTVSSLYTVQIYFFRRSTNIYEYVLDTSDFSEKEIEILENSHIDMKKK